MQLVGTQPGPNAIVETSGFTRERRTGRRMSPCHTWADHLTSRLQTQTHPKEDDEQEDLEEGAEDVGVAADEENEGDEGGDTSIEDGRPHVHQRGNE